MLETTVEIHSAREKVYSRELANPGCSEVKIKWGLTKARVWLMASEKFVLLWVSGLVMARAELLLGQLMMRIE